MEVCNDCYSKVCYRHKWYMEFTLKIQNTVELLISFAVIIIWCFTSSVSFSPSAKNLGQKHG